MARFMKAGSQLMRLVKAAESSGSPTMYPAQVAAAPCRSMGFGANVHENDPDVIEKEKQRNLEGNKNRHSIVDGWNEKLASDAEAVVKADRHVEHDNEDHDAHIQDLQKHTERKAADDHA